MVLSLKFINEQAFSQLSSQVMPVLKLFSVFSAHSRGKKIAY
jgi:hypothetical protein